MATTPLPAAPSADPIQSALRQQQSGREALIQSQALWASGSRDQAIDLLQQAEAAAERNAQSSPSASNTQHLATLVRELARMLLAQGRAVGALDMLVRVEPQLNGEADIWALRANVAQRLGRHQDSVAAYTVALQSRPTEQRWLLGSAVSFAALGQIAQATDLAEKARLVGTISPEVQTYLRQMGVNLKDQ
jgi:tetratricopeptide (TPR) repeat protein